MEDERGGMICRGGSGFEGHDLTHAVRRIIAQLFHVHMTYSAGHFTEPHFLLISLPRLVSRPSLACRRFKLGPQVKQSMVQSVSCLSLCLLRACVPAFIPTYSERRRTGVVVWGVVGRKINDIICCARWRFLMTTAFAYSKWEGSFATPSPGSKL